MNASMLSRPEPVPTPMPAAPRNLARRLRSTLRARPAVDGSRVAFSIDESGRVTLEGSVATYAEKCAIEEAVKRVSGVAGVRNRIEVRLTIGDYRPDATLERVLHDLFEFLSRMPPERPRAIVENGWVTLQGTVVWPHQKRLIESAVREIAGVKGITNRLTIKK